MHPDRHDVQHVPLRPPATTHRSSSSRSAWRQRTRAAITVSLAPPTEGAELDLHLPFMAAWGALHPLFHEIVQALTSRDRPRLAHVYAQVANVCTGEQWKLCFEQAAFATGARQLTEPFTQGGVNCALYALGKYIGFTDSSEGLVQRGAIVTVNHCLSVETLMKALSGDADYGACGLLPLWREILPALDFEAVAQSACAPGDIVVYTRESCVVGKTKLCEGAKRMEVASHFAVVRQVGTAGSQQQIIVASKNGVADESPTYLHPVGLIDVNHLVSAHVDAAAPSHSQPPSMVRAHFFRPPANLKPNSDAHLAKLYALACRMENRMEELLLGESSGRAVTPGAPSRSEAAPRGKFIKFEGMPCSVAEARLRGLRCGPFGIIPP